MQDVFEHTLQDVYYAENALTKALPKVADAASNADLKKGLTRIMRQAPRLAARSDGRTAPTGLVRPAFVTRGATRSG
jgi:hypothetical protein